MGVIFRASEEVRLATRTEVGPIEGRMPRWFQSLCRTKSVVRTLTCLAVGLWAGCRAGKAPTAQPGTAPVATASAGSKPSPEPAPAPVPGAEEVTEGKLLHLQLEGGFWGVITPAGEKLRLHQAPPSVWKGGEAVRMRFRRLEDGPSIFQWGRPVEWLSIEAAGKRQGA